MATIDWGIPQAAVAILEKRGGKVDNAIVTDIEYGQDGKLERIYAGPVDPQDEILRAHPGETDTVAK